MTIVKTYKGYDVPEGATHYGAKTWDWTEAFYNMNDHTCFLAGEDDKWDHFDNSRNDLIKLPQEPEQWMPEVGEECEWRGKSGGFWVKAKVSAIEFDTFVFWQDENSKYRPNKFEIMEFSSVNVRPIKTKRERFIEQGIELRQNFGDRDLLEQLFDNGARFSEG